VTFDIFFSISHVPVGGHTPTEASMFRNFFDQVRAADEQGYGVAWVAESHLSSEVQKLGSNPVIPHWQGEVGLNTDITQLAHAVFGRTKRIEVGSAIMNIICNGGPVAAAEKVATFAAIHGADPNETRRLHAGFAYGRFEFMNRAYGIGPRNELEGAAWKGLKGQVYREAAEIFLRLLRGDVLSSDDITAPTLQRRNFRSEADWLATQALAGTSDDTLHFDRRWTFEKLKIVPQDWRRELIQPIAGTHDPEVQTFINTILPCQVFNLSITNADVIESTHERMAACYHPDGGPWQRGHMPRTTFVFLNEQPGLTPEQRRAAAHEEAQTALGAYWTALQGTLDPAKVAKARQRPHRHSRRHRSSDP